MIMLYMVLGLGIGGRSSLAERLISMRAPADGEVSCLAEIAWGRDMDKVGKLDALLDVQDCVDMVGESESGEALVLSLLKAHPEGRISGEVEMMMHSVELHVRLGHDKPGHRHSVTCDMAEQVILLLTKWRIDAALSISEGRPTEERRTVLKPMLECTGQSDLESSTCDIWDQVDPYCPGFSAMKSFRDEMFEYYTNLAIDESEGLESIAYKGEYGTELVDVSEYFTVRGVQRKSVVLMGELHLCCCEIDEISSGVTCQLTPERGETRFWETHPSCGGRLGQGFHSWNNRVAFERQDVHHLGRCMVPAWSLPAAMQQADDGDEDIEYDTQEQWNDTDLAGFLEEEPETQNEVQENQLLTGMVLQRVQRLNTDLAAINCAEITLDAELRRVKPNYTAGRSPEDLKDCKALLADLVLKREARRQRSSKCCCRASQGVGATICKQHMEDDLERSMNPFSFRELVCPSAWPVKAEDDSACSTAKHGAPRFHEGSLMQLAAGGELTDSVRQSLREYSQEFTNELATVKDELSNEREHTIEGAAHARDHLEWFDACRPGRRLHKWRPDKKKTKKCKPQPAHLKVKGCPAALQTFCYDDLPEARCCCDLNGVDEKSKGLGGKKKTATGRCALALGREEDKRRREEADRKAELEQQALPRLPSDGGVQDQSVSDSPKPTNSPRGFYPACQARKRVHTVRLDRKGGHCKEASRPGNCPARNQLNQVNVVDFTMFCYADQPEERCCCRERDIREQDGGVFGGKHKEGTDLCAVEWPQEEDQVTPTRPSKESSGGFFGGFFGGRKPTKPTEVVPDFNNIFTDTSLNAHRDSRKHRESWGKSDKEWAATFQQKIEKLLTEWNKAGKKGDMWTCDEAVKQTCRLRDGGKSQLRHLVARANYLSKKIKLLIQRNDQAAQGNPMLFESVAKCAESVIKEYRNPTQTRLQVLDTHVRKIARDFAHMDIGSDPALYKVFGVVLRAITTVVGGLLYLPMVPFVMISEGIRSVQNSGQLWRFPIGFLFAGPVVSLFGKVHFESMGDFATNQDNGYFRWGIAGAATRASRLFKRPSARELAEDVPEIMRLLAQLHRMLNIANQCGETVQFSK
eukprot:TRINITY_DN23157_c0_g1_i1.p1 TRINITY_DN23157_c0_g1~~TRINITY_DN23157_c0_g1_i1.p1  ORF type:complete len:1092 (+),score=236.25 TRINITY_DN23157_c0_g1_i1:45-3320(+)